MDTIRSFVINLDRRVERWKVAKEELSNHGFHSTRFSGIDKGWRGCRDSHLTILEYFIGDNVFAIFEDDVLFLSENTQEDIRKALDQLPSDWDCLYLGASPQEPQERYSDNLFRIKNSWCMHAILWHNREGGAIEYLVANKHRINKIDVFMAKEVMPKFNCFLIYPMLCTQRETGTSDTCGRSNVLTIKNNYDKYCSIQ